MHDGNYLDLLEILNPNYLEFRALNLKRMDSLNETEGHFILRRCILKTLYDFFRACPFGLAELRTIDETCRSDPEELNWNIVYLEKCGYVELDKSMDCPPYVSCTAGITAKGIDLVENNEKFNYKFNILP